MTPGEAPRETVRLLADLDIEKPSLSGVPVEELPLRSSVRPAARRRSSPSLDAEIAKVLSEAPSPLSAGDIARAIGRGRKEFSTRLPACFVEVGKGRWWSPDRGLPFGVDDVVTLPRNVRDRVRAEASIGRDGCVGFARRRS